jgi:serine/threonine-protein kinase RsbW
MPVPVHDLLILATSAALHAEITGALAGSNLDGVFANSIDAMEKRYADDGARVLLVGEAHAVGDGWDRIVAMVKAPTHGVTTPVLVALEGSDPDAVLEWLRRGAFACVTRPIDPQRLPELVRTVRQATRASSPALQRMVIDTPLRGWVELTAPSRAEFLVRFDSFIQLLHTAGLDDLTRRQVVQAVNELGQNAIEWGNTYDDSKQVRISYCVFDDRIIFKIEDEGAGFDPAAVRDPTIDPIQAMEERLAQGKRAGGYGLAMVRKIMDEVMFNERGNVVICEKRFTPAAPRPETA